MQPDLNTLWAVPIADRYMLRWRVVKPSAVHDQRSAGAEDAVPFVIFLAGEQAPEPGLLLRSRFRGLPWRLEACAHCVNFSTICLAWVDAAKWS